tara:strand:- start:551 stop:2017 length:1467 start_codon:yes stop_codon:yes gene_type:complete
MDRRSFLKKSALLTISGPLASCATNPVTGEKDLILLSEDEETELGRNSHKQVMRSYSPYNHPELIKYITMLGEKLAEISHRNDLIYHFTLLDSPQVNAFAIPGGYIYITRGMLAYLKSEAELAGVLGHELGHITAKHGVKQYSKSQVANILGTVFGIVVGDRNIANLGRLASTAIIRGYGREAELEADKVGAEYIAKVGYDPDALQDVIGVLKNQEEFDKVLAEEENRDPYAYHGVFATHPDNDKRLQGVIKAAKASLSEVKLENNEKKYLELIEGIPFGPGEGQGSARGSSFYHTDLDFTLKFPDGWKIENLPTAVLGTSADREVLIELTMRDLNRKISAKELMSRLYGDNLENGREIKVSEYQGYAATVEMDTTFGSAHKCRVAILYKNKKEAFQFIATTKKGSEYRKYILAFDDTIESLRKLKTSEKHLGEPKRIHIHKVKMGETFKSLSKKTAFTTHAENRLRVINNKFPSGQPKAGSLVKLVY